MSSKDEDQADSSRFTLDGVVAEMVIEVEENEQNSFKPPNLKKLDEFKNSKSSALKKISLHSQEDSDNDSSSASKDDDLSEKENSDTVEAKSSEGLQEKSSNMDTDGLEDKEVLMETEDILENKDDDVGEENKDVEDLKDTKKMKMVKSTYTGEVDSELSNESPNEIKKLRGRPKKKAVSKSEELKKETRQLKADPSAKSDEEAESSQLKTRTSALKSKSSQPSTNISLKRSNKAAISSDEKKYEVPEKKLRSYSEDIPPKRPKRSVSFSPVATEVDSTKRQSLRKTTLLKTTQTPSKSTPIASKATPSTSKSTPSTSKVTSSTSKGTPASNKTTPASNKATPASNKATPVSGKGSVVKPALSVKSNLKAWDLDPECIYNLESFPEIKKQVKQAEVKVLKSLHRTLFNKILPKDVLGKDLRKEILKFQGYSFKESSDKYKKHRSILEKMPESTIAEIAKILDFKEEDISKIMKFLLKPSKVIYCEVDPFHPSMQPVLKLQKITLENASAKTLSDDSSNNEPFSSEGTLATSKRKRFPSTKLRFYESDFDVSAPKKKSQETERPRVASSLITNIKKEFPSTVAKKPAIPPKVQNVKQAIVKREKHRVKIEPKRKIKRSFGPTPLPGGKMGIVKKPISSDIQVRRRALELAIEIQETVNSTELEESGELEEFPDLNEDEESALASFEYESDIKQEVVTEDESEDQEHSIPVISDISDNLAFQESETKSSENTSSDVTLSADEAKEATQEEAPQRKRFYKPTVIPLKSYPTIKENILKADYSALQRLHIVLFGASDKASNLRGNILSFGGFPFYEGSEEWKQKEFLLSLLSQTTLKEYLDILGIKYRDGNQRLLIKKLMKFLAAPIEKLPDDDIEDDDDDLEMEIVSLEEMVPIIPTPEPKKAPVKTAPVPKKKPIKKPVAEKKPPRFRKVLMDEAQVRRLEADLAREQRILEREKKLHEEQAKKLRLSSLHKPKPFQVELGNKQAVNQTDTELLNALLETVYQRRELKKAGAKVSIPNKGGHTRLGELANVKFLVVTANYNDLDVLHHLIYMTEANKSRVRKNILDFAGFNFTEESPAYQDRMHFLTSLGYDISRRIAFLLGLCPYKTLIAQQDLNELIMYFLMSPCQSKQVPIRHLPNTFFGKDMPVELSALVQKHSEDPTISTVDESAARLSEEENKSLEISVSENRPSPSQEGGPRRARKSFKSTFNSSKMRGLTPSISTLPLKTPEKLLKPTFVSQKPMQSSTKPAAAMFAQQAIKTPTPQSAPAPSQEFYIQQQTADGQQKTFKLVKLPPNHPLSSAFKSQLPQPAAIAPEIQPQQITINAPVIGAPGLPPGLIVFKNNPTNPALSSVMHTVPLAIGQTTENMINPLMIPSISNMNPGLLNKLGENRVILPKPTEVTEEVLPDEKDVAVPVECNYSSDEEAEELCPLEDGNPPTDEEIYGSIQDIIHGCPSLEDITLRNVISRVSAKYPNFDLTPQHYFMKECVKKIIMGT